MNKNLFWNGFYYLHNLKSLESLKTLYYDALSLSDNSYVHEIKPGSYRRELIDMTCEDYIENYLTLQSHNVVINRYIYNNEADWGEKNGEIGSCTMYGRQLYLFIYLTLENLNYIVNKYNLQKHI